MLPSGLDMWNFQTSRGRYQTIIICKFMGGYGCMHGLKNRSKTGETGPDRFDRPVNLIFFKKLIFLKKMVYRFRYRFTGNTDRFTADFNHYRPTGLPILDFSNAKFEFGVVFVVTGHTGGKRFSRPYRFFNPWLYV
jgi:hypothetical protein